MAVRMEDTELTQDKLRSKAPLAPLPKELSLKERSHKTVKAHVETSERGLKLKSHQGRGKYFTGAGNGALKQDF